VSGEIKGDQRCELALAQLAAEYPWSILVEGSSGILSLFAFSFGLFSPPFLEFVPRRNDIELSCSGRVKTDETRKKQTKRTGETRMNAVHTFLAPTHALRRLHEFLHETGSKLSTADAAAMAINQWIATKRGQPV
jgi:hypothetical protein